MKIKGIQEAKVRAAMSLYNGEKTKMNVGTHLSEEFEVIVGVHQGSYLSLLSFAIMNDLATNEIMGSRYSSA